MTRSKLILLGSLVLGACCGTFRIPLLSAAGEDPLVNLSKQVMEAKTIQELVATFEGLKEYYFKDHKYSEFVDYLKSLGEKKKTNEPFTNYYTALARYQHLKYLEEAQLWDEYFSQGNNYRDELTRAAQSAIDSTTTKDPLHIRAELVSWQFHKDQQDVFAEDSLSALMSSVMEYTVSSGDPQPVKEAADKLLAYQEKGKAKELYKIYAQKIISSGLKDEALRDSASNFYKEGNLELAENIYDAYTDRVLKSAPKEISVPLLREIAKSFAYKDEGASDSSYAEKIFKKVEETGGKEAFDQELMYLRAFNLEKAKEYPQTRDAYLNLASQFPQTSHNDEAIFKAGLISAYALRDLLGAKSYFEKLTQREKDFSPQSISSFYQLGLLSQWENDAEKAKDYYNKLISTAGENFPESVAQARERLKEIEEARPLEYNLRTFLDLSFKDEFAVFDRTKLDLKSSRYRPQRSQDLSIHSTAYTAPTGCMQVELQYLWSGDLGKSLPTATQNTLETSYDEPGTKEINLVVVSPSGIIDRAFDIVDAQ